MKQIITAALAAMLLATPANAGWLSELWDAATQPPADGHWWQVSVERNWCMKSATSPEQMHDLIQKSGLASLLVNEPDGVFVTDGEGVTGYKFFPSRAACNNSLIALGYQPLSDKEADARQQHEEEEIARSARDNEVLRAKEAAVKQAEDEARAAKPAISRSSSTGCEKHEKQIIINDVPMCVAAD